MWRWGGFWALHKGNVNGGIRRGRRTAVQHRGVMKRASIFFIEVLQPRGIWRKEKLSEGICQSRSRLNLAELCRSGRQMMLAQHWPLRGLTFWDAAKTWKQKNKQTKNWIVDWCKIRTKMTSWGKGKFGKFHHVPKIKLLWGIICLTLNKILW